MIEAGKQEKLTTALVGTPYELFLLLLNDNSAEFYKNSTSSPSFSGTVGLFVYRHELVLLALEIYAGRTLFKETLPSKTTVVSSHVPSILKQKKQTKERETDDHYVISLSSSIAEDKEALGVLNPQGNSLVPYSYLDGKIEVDNTVNITHGFSTGIIFRIGSIIKDRFYAFAILGAELNNISIKTSHQDKEFPQFSLYTCLPTYVSASSMKFYVYKIDPHTTETHSIYFDKNKLICGIVGGGGMEFFVTRKVSLRADITYTYCADMRISSSNKLAELLYSSRRWKFGCGIYYRL
jgi:hypothetical protein